MAEHLWIVGPGRLGLAIGTYLVGSDAVARLTYIGRRDSPPTRATLPSDPRVGYSTLHTADSRMPDAVLLTVPDAAIPLVARELASLPLPDAVPVLHTSGATGAEPLAPLADAGHPVGSLHPLAAVADAEAGAERLRGAWFAVEGDGAARALAETLVDSFHGQVLDVSTGAKPLYHAAAVFASNYIVTLLSVAERMFVEAGASPEDARSAAATLANGAVANTGTSGAPAALTGPIARGDSGTIALHLAQLSASDRTLYSRLARQTLALARESGLEPAAATEIERLLREEA